MSLKQLKYLIALYEESHFGRAAERCHVTQSTLSLQISKLEDYLGVLLFKRTSRNVSATPFADNIVPRVRQVVSMVDSIRQDARRTEV
jgi:LysR family hydrogen peroxide-inducible transcriptional activator